MQTYYADALYVKKMSSMIDVKMRPPKTRAMNKYN